MHIRHWAYIGVTLVAVNASILGGARAAEFLPNQPFYHHPGLLRFSLSRWLPKRRRALLAPVSIRLFIHEKVQNVWLKSPTGFIVGKRRLQSPLWITLQNGRLQMFSRGEWRMLGSDFALRQPQDQPFEIKTHYGKSRLTSGDLHIRLIKGRVQVINRLEIEDYVSGVLEGELGSLKLSPEVLKAQAIVARSYVMSMRGERHAHEGYEFCDQPHCQVYAGIPVHDPLLDRTMNSVRGEYLAYHHRPAAAFYHHNCGGMTSAVQDVWPSSGRAYLKAIQEPLLSGCRLSAKSRWHMSFSKNRLETYFRNAGWLKRGASLEFIEIIKVDPSGRAQRILIGSRKGKVVSVDSFRHLINQANNKEVLKSAMFSVSRSGDSFSFSGRGWGHGVGFCQEGAMWMARNGKTYRQILQHYFPHTHLSKTRS